MSTHDDHATLIDSLDRIRLVSKLAREVKRCTPPRVYGVHGDWGAGKTSFLHQLHRTLDGLPAREDWVKRQNDAHVKIKEAHCTGARARGCEVPVHTSDAQKDPLVVWFEAWRYQHEPAPVVALLHEMRGQLGVLARLKDNAFKIGETTIRSALIELEQLAKFVWLQSPASITTRGSPSGLVQTIQSQGERWEREHLAEKLPAESIREQLEHAVGTLLGHKGEKAPADGRRVVVLIDDLDRCEPQATYRLLEGIKIYLNIPNCVFVLGMDQRIIEDAIAETAPGAKDNPDLARRRAREYLEKLFQEVYHLPIVQDTPSHLMSWLPADATRLDAARRQELADLLAAYPECLPANPRKLKAFAVVLWRFLTECETAKAADEDYKDIPEHAEHAAHHRFLSLAVIMASLYHFHPRIYRILEAHAEDFYPKLWAWCANENPNPPKEPDKDQEVNVEKDHDCLVGLDREGRPKSPAEQGMNTLPDWISNLPDYSRGDVARVQRLIYHARPFAKPSVVSFLLR